MITTVDKIRLAAKRAKAELDMARLYGDPLRIDLAEAALNDLLDRLPRVTDVTRNRSNK
jgi:hypothetical protein